LTEIEVGVTSKGQFVDEDEIERLQWDSIIEAVVLY